MSYFTGT